MATVNGTPGNDTLPGTPANDTFAPLGGNDSVAGNGGFDTLDYRTSPASIAVNFQAGAAQDGFGGTDSFTGISAVLGSAFADTLTGTAQGTFLTHLRGEAGNDALIGEAGNRSTIAEYADSPAAIQANLATGIVQDGHGGTDTLTNIRAVAGSAFADTLLGGDGNDLFRGLGGNDSIDGAGGTGNRAGYDSSPAGVVVDLAAGTAQDGHGGVDTLANIQDVEGSGFDDTLRGDANNNVLIGNEGADTLDGREGYDTAAYDNFARSTPIAAGVTASLVTGMAADPFGTMDTLISIEALHGTRFADDLTGAALAGGVRSNLRGLRGNDTLRAPGQDTNVAADYRGDAAGVTVNLAAGTATDGSGGTDTLVNIQAVRGSDFADSITGSDRNDWLSGEDGNDTILGGKGDDRLVGNAGDDLLDGGDGKDRVDVTDGGFRGSVLTVSGADLVHTRGTQVDTYRNVEEIRFLDGRLVLDASDPAAQVVRLYQAALGRGPDQEGLNFWIGRLQSGATTGDLGASFLRSPEFIARFGTLDDAGYVGQLYQNVLNRPGDAGGTAFWIGQLQGGAPRANVLAGFAESSENKAITAPLIQAGIWDRSEAAQQVARLYDAVLDRLPDAGGLDFWTARIADGTSNTLNVAEAFAASTEFTSRYGSLGNRDYVQTLYQNTLNRAGDPAGVDFWTGRLDAGALTRAGVAQGFSESVENIVRTAPLFGGQDPATYGVTLAA